MKRLLEDWEYNVLGIYNYTKPGPFSPYFDFVIENHQHITGDIGEVGVYRGSSLLATAMLLKELGSDKRVWGYDGFSGFPVYHPNDDLAMFGTLYQQGVIDADLYRKSQLNIEYRSLASHTKQLDATNISSSGDFSNTNLETLQAKIAYLELDNIELVVGNFQDTMNAEHHQASVAFCAVLLDCDLYDSYRIALPFVWDRLSRGGYMFIDEYYSLKFPGARIACDEFFMDRKDKPQQHRPIPRDFQRWFVRKIFS